MPALPIQRLGRAAALPLVLAALAASPAPAASEEAPGSVRVRVMAANTSSGRFQSYPDPGPGTRIFRALAPDVVLIQEFNVNAERNSANDDGAVDAWVDAVFGLDYHWFREPGGDSIPNGVISRWPIVEAGQWDDPEVSNRDFAFARIDLPGEVDLWVVSVHFLTRSAGARDAQARKLVAAIRGQPVPEADYLVVGGDFNTNRRNEPALGTLRDVVDTLGPYPDDGADPADEDTNRRRRKPYDWVLADGDLQSFAAATEIGDFSFPNGLVFDSRVFSTEDLEASFPPVRRDDSDAENMQHMAVVRDFLIPVGPAAPIGDFTVAPSAVDFGSVDPAAGPFEDASVEISIVNPVALTAVAFDGGHPAEFELVEPDLAGGPVRLEADTRLTFRWSPGAEERAARRVTATVVTDGEPGAFEIALSGALRGAAAGVPLDLAGFRLEQTGGEAALTFPAGTAIPPGGLLVVGRAASRAEFEAFWGPLDPEVVYLNGLSLAGEPGFPIVNGGERYRLVDAAGAAVDPAAGTLPAGATPSGRAYVRDATDGTGFTALDDPVRSASPGRFEGVAAGTGRLVITEFADAPGSGSFIFEFVELMLDATPSP